MDKTTPYFVHIVDILIPCFEIIKIINLTPRRKDAKKSLRFATANLPLARLGVFA